jgi:exodeoxyribonuclease VII small subunit
MAKSESKPVDKLTYEEALQELEKIVADLEAGEGSLDDSLRLFERGQALARHCSELLQKAELKVRSLTAPEDTEPGEPA